MEEDKLNKAIKGLEYCLAYTQCPDDCPYWMPCDQRTPPDELLSDALELLMEVRRERDCG